VPDLTLVVMAAGIGSRYGGLKQAEPIGPAGELVIDYSVHDALRAGFDRVVLVIRREIEGVFREKVGARLEARARISYVFQELEALPEGFPVPAGRAKPWGTGQAVLVCAPEVAGPFAVINADDFYGADAFRVLAGHLRSARDTGKGYDYSLVGYVLANTLSEHGHVARGVCEVSPDGLLRSIHERTRIQKFPDGVRFSEDGGRTWTGVSPRSAVSMNMWGFTPSVFAELEARFRRFLAGAGGADLKAEFYLPVVAGELVAEGRARITVLPTSARWFGVTYRGDLPEVQAAVRALVERGEYPRRLWG
jgi:hypothetical protein